MADRYQDRPFPAHDDYGRGSEQHGHKGEGDPLAELARLIGQTDPFAMKSQPPSAPRHQPPPYQSQDQYEPESYEPAPEPAAGPPPWMQRANARAQQPAQQHYEDETDYQPSPVHPLHRHGAQQPAAYHQEQYQDEQPYADDQQYVDERQLDPSRYDDALYGQIESSQDYQRDPAYPDDPYAYQGAYDEEPEEQPRKRGGMVTVAAVLALAVLGTGGAFAYRNFIGSPRSGEPPIIKADNSPTKIVPAQSDAAAKAPDRMTFGDGSEKIVPREETPVDVNARSGPRVVFPPLNQNVNPPSPASVAPSAPPAPTAAANGTLPNNEPRRIKTLSVKGDAADAGMPPAAPPRPAPAQVAAPRAQPPLAPPPGAPSRNPPTSANASANAPLSLAPGAPAAAEPPARMAAVNPAPAPAAGGGYVVQVSSQKTEADAQASYRSLQSKFPNVLGSRAPLIKRADLGDKGVFYRAMVGPFGTRDEAAQFCSNLKTAGGQCVIQSN